MKAAKLTIAVVLLVDVTHAHPGPSIVPVKRHVLNNIFASEGKGGKGKGGKKSHSHEPTPFPTPPSTQIEDEGLPSATPPTPSTITPTKMPSTSPSLRPPTPSDIFVPKGKGGNGKGGKKSKKTSSSTQTGLDGLSSASPPSTKSKSKKSRKSHSHQPTPLLTPTPTPIQVDIINSASLPPTTVLVLQPNKKDTTPVFPSTSPSISVAPSVKGSIIPIETIQTIEVLDENGNSIGEFSTCKSPPTVDSPRTTQVTFTYEMNLLPEIMADQVSDVVDEVERKLHGELVKKYLTSCEDARFRRILQELTYQPYEVASAPSDSLSDVACLESSNNSECHNVNAGFTLTSREAVKSDEIEALLNPFLTEKLSEMAESSRYISSLEFSGFTSLIDPVPTASQGAETKNDDTRKFGQVMVYLLGGACALAIFGIIFIAYTVSRRKRNRLVRENFTNSEDEKSDSIDTSLDRSWQDYTASRRKRSDSSSTSLDRSKNGGSDTDYSCNDSVCDHTTVHMHNISNRVEDGNNEILGGGSSGCPFGSLNEALIHDESGVYLNSIDESGNLKGPRDEITTDVMISRHVGAMNFNYS